MSAEFGSDVEILDEDLLALRKLDLIGIHHGELVITDLGQGVGAELRRRSGLDESTPSKLLQATERAGRMISELQGRGEGSKTLIPIELAVLAAKGRTDGDDDTMMVSSDDEEG